ncbi:MAG: hypothetical protein PWQ77_1648 [Kosmotogales bacterium]|nr:hypothetical protein [Kosmotogales bacterium]
MGAKTDVKLEFSNKFKGILHAKNGEIKIGIEKGEVAPYDMLLGSLGSCLYATFLGIANKKRIDFKSVEIKISGEKREEIPTTLKEVKINIIITNAEKEKGLIQAVDLAAKYCSVFSTISSVAKIDYDVDFVYT